MAEKKDVTVTFSEKMIQAQKEVEFDGKTRTRSLVRLPKNAEHAGFLWETTVPIRNSAFGKEGMKYAYVDPDYDNYKLVRTPRTEDGSLDFANQEVVKVNGAQLKAEVEAWKEQNQEKQEDKQTETEEPDLDKLLAELEMTREEEAETEEVEWLDI